MAKQKNTSASLDSLSLSFKEKHFAPLYLFHGEEDFLIEEAIDELLEHAIDQSTKSFNLDVLYGSDIDARDVVALGSSFPMMAERRVVIIREVDKLITSESSRDILLRYLENPMLSTTLAFVASKVDMRLAFFKQFQKNGTVVEFKALSDHQIPAWIERRVEKFGWKITPEASQLMHGLVGRSLREIYNEIEKLFIYVGKKKLIEAEDVGAVVGMSKTFTVFELQKAIGQGNVSHSIEILEHMMEAGESPLGIIVMFTRYFQKLWLLPSFRQQSKSDYDLAAALAVPPFFIQEYISACQRYSPSHVEQAFSALLEADVTLKSTQEDPKLVMTTLVCKLIRPVEEAAAY